MRRKNLPKWPLQITLEPHGVKGEYWLTFKGLYSSPTILLLKASELRRIRRLIDAENL